jgi:hypothetical protein
MSLDNKILALKLRSTISYIYLKYIESRFMPKTTLTLSEQIAKALKVYTVQTKSSMHAQSLVVEEALREFFERHGVKIEG